MGCDIYVAATFDELWGRNVDRRCNTLDWSIRVSMSMLMREAVQNGRRSRANCVAVVTSTP